MSTEPRRARLCALAKINLGLRVLGKRPDGYHELRTVFQTISLADTLDVEFTPSRRTQIEITGSVEIPDNLVTSAAGLALDAMGSSGQVKFHLVKRIPMGAGLGGGSSDAAAVLLALPVLAGKALALEELIELASRLGSDVPFFLLGGAALGLGRGTELYPLPDPPATHLVVVAPAVHVSTREAYGALGRRLTSDVEQNMIDSFQSRVWQGGLGVSKEGPPVLVGNDFESVVLNRHPELKWLKRKLVRLGARAAMMTGSGAALFGVFGSRADAAGALAAFGKEQAFSVSMVSRARYRAMWWRALAAHSEGKTWPPRSRYWRRCTIV